MDKSLVCAGIVVLMLQILLTIIRVWSDSGISYFTLGLISIISIYVIAIGLNSKEDKNGENR